MFVPHGNKKEYLSKSEEFLRMKCGEYVVKKWRFFTGVQSDK